MMRLYARLWRTRLGDRRLLTWWNPSCEGCFASENLPSLAQKSRPRTNGFATACGLNFIYRPPGLRRASVAEGRRLLSLKVAVADVGEVCGTRTYVRYWAVGGVIAPDQRIEATLRVVPGGPVERATYPPGTAHRNRWPVRHRSGRMRRRTLTGDRTPADSRSARPFVRAGECLSQVPLH